MPLPARITDEVNDILGWADHHTAISTPDTYTRASEALGAVSALRRKITTHYAEIKKPSAVAHKAHCKLEKDELARLAPAETALREALLAYEDRALPADVPRLKGQYTTATPSVVIEDFHALVSAVAAGTVPLDALKPNVAALNRIARRDDALYHVPGTRVDQVRVVVVP